MRRLSVVYLVVPGLVGGLVAVAASLVLRSVRGTAILGEIAADATTFILGPEGFSYLLSKLGANGKPLLFLGVLLGQLAVYTLTSVVVAYAVWRRRGEDQRQSADLLRHVGPFGLQAVLTTGVFLLASLILISSTAAEMPSRTGWHEYALATLGLAALYAAVAEALRTLLSQPRREERAAVGERALSRRRFLRLAGGYALGLAAAVFIGRQVVERMGGGAQRSYVGRPTPETTANEDFYVVSKNFFDPKVDADDWRLRVGGSAQRMLELTYDDIRHLPAQEEFVTLQCISNEVGGDLIGNALWKGFPLRVLLEAVEPLPSARFVFFRSYDDYSESLPLEFATQDKVMLVYEMNGQPLPFKHGFPLRLLAPGKYGIKHPKWLTEIALVDEERFGYWQQRGWSQEARMHTSCRIDVPASLATIEEGPFRMQGLAFSGDRGISRVEVTTDGGQTWHDATLRPALAPFTWVLWHYDWNARAQEDFVKIMARATDDTGQVQTAR
ncbi:MAG: molybdopterin-dependent oxidoreductase, partial [Dehalococcoidia bacterium]